MIQAVHKSYSQNEASSHMSQSGQSCLHHGHQPATYNCLHDISALTQPLVTLNNITFKNDVYPQFIKIQYYQWQWKKLTIIVMSLYIFMKLKKQDIY